MLGELTDLKKSTLSMVIKRLYNQGKIKIRKVRKGRSTLSLISLAPPHPPLIPKRQVSKAKTEEEKDESQPDFNSRLTDPAYLRELLIRGEIAEEYIDLLGEPTLLGMADATIAKITQLGIPSEVAEEILGLVEDALKFQPT